MQAGRPTPCAYTGACFQFCQIVFWVSHVISRLRETFIGNGVLLSARPNAVAQCFVLGGCSAFTYDAPVIHQLRAAAARHPGVVLVLDPDHAGRAARSQLDRELPGCLHAFLPLHAASAQDLTRCGLVSGVQQRMKYSQSLG